MKRLAIKLACALVACLATVALSGLARYLYLIAPIHAADAVTLSWATSLRIAAFLTGIAAASCFVGGVAVALAVAGERDE